MSQHQALGFLQEKAWVSKSFMHRKRKSYKSVVLKLWPPEIVSPRNLLQKPILRLPMRAPESEILQVEPNNLYHNQLPGDSQSNLSHGVHTYLVVVHKRSYTLL